MAKEIVQPLVLSEKCQACVAKMAVLGVKIDCPFINLSRDISKINGDVQVLDPNDDVHKMVLSKITHAALAYRLLPGIENENIAAINEAAAECPGAVIVEDAWDKTARSIMFSPKSWSGQGGSKHYGFDLQEAGKKIDVSAIADADSIEVNEGRFYFLKQKYNPMVSGATKSVEALAWQVNEVRLGRIPTA